MGHDRKDGQYNPRWMPSQRVLAVGRVVVRSAVSRAPESHRLRRSCTGAAGTAIVDPGPTSCLDTLEASLALHGHVARVGDAPAAHAHPPRPRRRRRHDPAPVIPAFASSSTSAARAIWSIRRSCSRAPRACTATTWIGCGARWRRCPSSNLIVVPRRRDASRRAGARSSVAYTPGTPRITSATSTGRAASRSWATRPASASTEATSCRRRRRPTSTWSCGARASQTIERWRPATLFLTHFGPVTAGVPRTCRRWPTTWSDRRRWCANRWPAEGTDEERKAHYEARMMRGTAGADDRGAGDGLRDRPPASGCRGPGWRGTGERKKPWPEFATGDARSVRDRQRGSARAPATAAGFGEQANRVALRRAGRRRVRAHPVDGRQQLAAPQHGGEVGAILRGPLHLEVHQPVQRNRRRHLALDEGVAVADVAGDHRREPQRAGGVAPRQAAGDRDAAAAPDAVAQVRVECVVAAAERFIEVLRGAMRSCRLLCIKSRTPGRHGRALPCRIAVTD